MKFEKDIVFFDLETTNADVNTARIVQIALIKIYNGERQFYKSLVNPLIPIPQEAIDVHGITNEMVANEKSFYQIAEDVVAFIGDSDLAGYNIIRFDIPVLIEELARTGRNWANKLLKSEDSGLPF